MKKTEKENLEKIKNVINNPLVSWVKLKGGLDSYTYEINGTWIFKIPKNVKIQKKLTIEKEFLDILSRTSPVPVPKFEYFEDSIAGYRKLVGKPMSKKIFGNISERSRISFAIQVGKFLKELHSIEFTLNRKSNYRNFFRKDGISHLLEDVQRHIFPKVTTDIQKNIYKYINEFQADKRNFENKISITHSDLFYSNILFNENTSRIAIIDFGDIQRDVIIKDFIFLVDFSDPQNDKILHVLLEAYGSEDSDLYRKVKGFSILEILYWAIDDIRGGKMKRNFPLLLKLFKKAPITYE